MKLVLAFTALTLVPFLGTAYHIDEPCFLAMAKNAWAHPAAPMDFLFNWTGTPRPMLEINPNFPLVPYILAPVVRLAGAHEWLARLLVLPFDLLAAASLYMIAARFLAAPLWPTLIVIAGPAYSLSMRDLEAEKWIAAFGYFGICVLLKDFRSSILKGSNEPALLRPDAVKQGRSFWVSACCLSLALLAKYSAAFLLAPALYWAWREKTPPRLIIAYLAIATLPALAWLLWTLHGSHAASGVLQHLVSTQDLIQNLRALPAFAGGLGVVTLLWPFKTLPRWLLYVVAVAAGLPFLPSLDHDQVRGLDRLLGEIFSAGAVAALVSVWRGKERFWLVWALAVAALQGFVYWSVVGRFVVFLMPPLVFGLAGMLEERMERRPLGRLYAGSFAATAALSLCLLAVDVAYSNAQRAMARSLPGRVRYTGHWGLQYYMDEAGASALDEAKGGWREAQPGDTVVMPMINSYILMPQRGAKLYARRATVPYWLPLRLMCPPRAGFYSSAWGFLPYAFSGEPLDGFIVASIPRTAK